MTVRIIHDDCLEKMAQLEENSIDSIVTDPPYGLEFMARAWDRCVPGVAFWKAALRIAKPGAHLVAFGGTRTYHRLAVAIEDAGWEIRDSLVWVYGSGFPKSLDVSKAIDKEAGAEHLRTFKEKNPASRPCNYTSGETSTGWKTPPRPDKTNPATDAARTWEGWGTALKPSQEPIVLARKPLSGTVAANVLEFGTGALNVDGCRVPCGDKAAFPTGIVSATERTFGGGRGMYDDRPRGDDLNPSGRWPTNLLLSHAPDCTEGGACVEGCPVAEMDRQSGDVTGYRGQLHRAGTGGGFRPADSSDSQSYGFNDSGGASRFFPRFRYEAKASTEERTRGAEHIEGSHPTVKPVELMRWLVRLVTPPGGTVLDPFAGSGTTGVAADREGFDAILIEWEREYVELIEARVRGDSPLFAQVVVE